MNVLAFHNISLCPQCLPQKCFKQKTFLWFSNKCLCYVTYKSGNYTQPPRVLSTSTQVYLDFSSCFDLFYNHKCRQRSLEQTDLLGISLQGSETLLDTLMQTHTFAS